MVPPQRIGTAAITAGGNSVISANLGVLSTQIGSISSGVPQSPANNPRYFNPSGTARDQKAAKDKELVNYAVAAQLSSMQQDVMDQAVKNHGDDLFGSVLSAPYSSVGGEEDPMAKYMNKSVMDGDAFKLPTILGCAENGSTQPFQGFLDVSIVNQKLRKALHS